MSHTLDSFCGVAGCIVLIRGPLPWVRVKVNVAMKGYIWSAVVFEWMVASI